MIKTLVVALGVAFALSIAAPVWADENPTYTGPTSASEASFVKAIQADLNKRFPTAADAEKAGYVRYTGEDDTGAISYADMHWQSADPGTRASSGTTSTATCSAPTFRYCRPAMRARPSGGSIRGGGTSSTDTSIG